jgi:hypothetical protein
LELFVNSSTSRSRRALNRGAIPIARIILYVKDIPTVARFYQTHFGMTPLPSTEDGWQELTGEPGSCQIALHRASARQKGGAAVKIVFGIADVRGFVEERAAGSQIRAHSRTGHIHVRECERPRRQFHPDFQSRPDNGAAGRNVIQCTARSIRS